MKKKKKAVNNTSLKVFRIAGNYLPDTAMQSMLTLFGIGSQLKKLDLLGNRITDHGVNVIVDKLIVPKCKKIKTINLSLNPFGERGCRKLLQTVKKNCFALESIVIDMGLSANIFGTNQSYKTYYQHQYNYYMGCLNKGGRKIYQQRAQKNLIDVNNSKNNSNIVLLGLWPFNLEYASRITYKNNQNDEQQEQQENSNNIDIDKTNNEKTLKEKKGAFIKGGTVLDVIYSLLHGPVLF